MTKEEYLAKTQIQSIEEAKTYLLRLRIFFISVFISMFLVKVFSDLFALYLVLLICFVIYCVKLRRLTKDVATTSAIWSVLFAPLSWIWFYPELTRPLRIIVGEIQPPEAISTIQDKQAITTAANKRFWGTIKTVVIVCALVLAIPVLVAYINSPNK